jgi:hypothetical protein
MGQRSTWSAGQGRDRPAISGSSSFENMGSPVKSKAVSLCKMFSIQPELIDRREPQSADLVSAATRLKELKLRQNMFLRYHL